MPTPDPVIVPDDDALLAGLDRETAARARRGEIRRSEWLRIENRFRRSSAMNALQAVILKQAIDRAQARGQGDV